MICAYGLLLMIPVVLVALAVSVRQLGMLTVLLPVLAVGIATFFLPFGFGNPYVARLVRSLPKPAAWEPGSAIVQLTLTPRLRSGTRALLEDADDVGWLGFSESTLVFQGDSVALSIPLAQIREVRFENIGARGLYLYPRLAISVQGLDGVQALGFADRSSWWLPAARRSTRAFQSLLAVKLAGAGYRPAGAK